MRNNNYVFLEGVGGIGKTELAKKYVENYGYKYNAVQFIKYYNYLKETIISSLKFENDFYWENDTKEIKFRKK